MARNLPLMLLGLTTLAIVYPMSAQWAAATFGAGTWAAFFTANLVTIIVYGSVDGVLELTLKFIDGTRPSSNGRIFYYSVCFLSLGALAASGTFSMWARPLIADLFRDKSNPQERTKELLMKEQDLQHEQIQASEKAIQAAIDSEPQRIAAARQEAEHLEAAAVASTSHSSWQRDYRAARNNPRHWFWTCTGGKGCPKGYRQYRDHVRAAREQGKALIAKQQNLVATLRASPTPSGRSQGLQVIRQLAAADSTEAVVQMQLFEKRGDAIVLSEAIALALVALITIIVLAGRKAYDVDLDIEPVTLFGAVEMLIVKVCTTLYGIYKEILDYISPETIKSLAMVPIVAAGNRITGHTKRTQQELQSKYEAAQRAAQAAETARQAAERARQEREAELEKERQLRRQEEYRRQQAEEQAQREEDRQKARQEEEQARQKARQEAADKIKEQTEKPTALSDNDYSVFVENGKIVGQFGPKEQHTWPPHEISSFLDVTKKWYARQYTSSRDSTRAKNAAKYQAAKAFLKQHGLTDNDFTEMPDKVEIDTKSLNIHYS